MKKYFFLLLFCFTIIGIAQNSTNKIPFEEKRIQLKNQDNLEEFLYHFFDEYLKTKNHSFLNKGIDSAWRKPINNDEKIALLHLKINIGYYYFNKGNISKSVKAYEKALLYYQKNNIYNYNIINYCLKPLANNYTRLGDYQRAKELYKYTLEIALKQQDNPALIGTYLNLAILLQSTNNNKEAINLLEKALNNKNLNSKQKNKLKVAIAKNNSLMGNYKESLLLLNKIPPNYQSEQIKAMCYLNTNQLDLAEKHINKAIKLLETTTYSKRLLAKTYNLLAKIQIKKSSLNKALRTYKESLKILLNDSDIKANLYAENTFLEIFDGNALIFTKQKNYQKALDNYQLAFKVSTLLQFTKSSQQSKIIQQQENRTRSEKMVSLYYNLYSENPKIEFIQKAFQSVETSKSKVLLEQLSYVNAKNRITKDSLLINEQILLKEKSILSKKIKLEALKHEKANIDLIKELTLQKTSITTQIEVLKQQIKNKYPFLNNGLKLTSVETIKKDLLFENQQLIEFFDTKNFIYIFSILKNQPIKWYRIEKDKKYHFALKTYIDLFTTKNGNQLKNDISNYQTSAYYLYQTLLEKVLSDNHGRTTIIPDGKLNFVAFDALLTNTNPFITFEKLGYLLYKKELNYGYSSTILLQQKEKSNTLSTQKSVLGFFPLFENNYRDLQELTYTLDEKKALNYFNHSLIFKKEQATKAQFLKWANTYKIIHLSTHASAGSFEEPAHIEFRNKTLYLPEIYGLKLQSNLLVLSACETGIGKLQKGEGAMSLARGFSYTGIKNLLVSQWKVNDKSTSILMQNFYKNYTKSATISNALYQAKLDYLQNKSISNLKKTPYHWAGFVFIGNTEVLNSSNNYLWLVLLLLGIVGLFFLVRKMRN
jgi:CHAT domain-containing protein